MTSITIDVINRNAVVMVEAQLACYPDLSMLRGSVHPLLEAEDLALDVLPGQVLPGHHQGLALCFGALPLTHRCTFQDTGPTSAYPERYLWHLLLRASSSPIASGWHLLREGTSLTESHWRLLRSQFPFLASVGRCYPPGLLAVHAGQSPRLPAPYPVPFGSSVSASCAGLRLRWLNTPLLALPLDAC
jgi:hypothetical protein